MPSHTEIGEFIWRIADHLRGDYEKNDNEDVILDVESIPTFNRTKPMLNEIKKKSAPEQVREEQPVKDKVEGTIRFE